VHDGITRGNPPPPELHIEIPRHFFYLIVQRSIRLGSLNFWEEEPPI
jgi:hypothetical protein